MNRLDRLADLWHRRRRRETQVGNEVRAELDFYLEMRTRELMSDGLAREEAQSRAREAFGRRKPIDTACRRLTYRLERKRRRGTALDSLFRDVRSAARALRRQPLVTAAAVTILALGIGTTSVVYGFVDTLLLRSLPVDEPERLVSLFNYTEDGGYYSSVAYPDYLDYRERSTTLADVIGYTATDVTLGATDRPMSIVAQAVSSNYFRGLGVAAALGRTFGSDQPDRPGEIDPIVVISHGLWQQRFGGDEAVIGKPITLDGQSATIVGVAAPGFRGLETESIADLWMPIGLFAQLAPSFADYLYNSRGSHWMMVVARIAPEASFEEARAELTALSHRQAEEYPDTNKEWSISMFGAGTGVVWPEHRNDVVLLASALSVGAALLLLIACANVANLLLARATGRRVEFGIRLALGAGRIRVVRQLLTESLLLALMSAVVGIILSTWIRAWLLASVAPGHLVHVLDPVGDVRALGFAALVAVVAGTSFGVAPALRVSNPDLMGSLKGTGATLSRCRRFSLRNALVVSQIALSLPLLVGATLIGQSLWNQLNIDLGVTTDDLLLVHIDPASANYSQGDGMLLYDKLLDRVRGLPGVASASYARIVPLGVQRFATDVTIAGRETRPDGRGDNVEVNIVAPGYPSTSGTSLLQGRDFDAGDTATGAPVIMINETMAASFWPNGAPLGDVIRVDWLGGPREARIVGVVADHGYGRIRDGRLQLQGARPRVYLPLSQTYQSSMTLLIRAHDNAERLAGVLVKETRTLLSDFPDIDVVTFREHVARLLPQQGLAALLLASASMVALVVAAVGIYGVMAHSVAQRTHEMGIRRALGAQRADVLRLVIGEGLMLTLMGIVFGSLAAFGLTRFLSGLLFGITATDSVSYVGVALTLTGVALLAGYLPGRAAARCDPLLALRRE